LTPVFDEVKKKRYLAHLKNEIREYSSVPISACEFWVSSIYFWGWTPSILSLEEIHEILECFPDYKDTTEITLEANPEDITEEYVRWLIDLGINRISLGVQTLNNDSLKEIHRSDRESIVHALENISWACHEKISVNIDFILGLPHVKIGETLYNIQELYQKFSCITHTSVYMLEDEAYPKHWKDLSITEIEIQKEFLEIMEYFKSLGWNHYELSNFAKPWCESLHNRAYWNHSNYRWFGLSASSYENGIRWTNSSSFSGYYKWVREWEEILTNEQIGIEKMMFGLRTGWCNCSEFLSFPSTLVGNPDTRFPARRPGNDGQNGIRIQKLISEWLLEIDGSKIKPTKTWIFLLDHIMSELV
jgi:coproporphyrinogen III oxidase-like Fe-S oxidoreductase